MQCLNSPSKLLKAELVLTTLPGRGGSAGAELSRSASLQSTTVTLSHFEDLRSGPSKTQVFITSLVVRGKQEFPAPLGTFKDSSSNLAGAVHSSRF